MTKGTEIQSLLLSKKDFSLKQAQKWLASNDFIHPKVHETEKYYRFRQISPEDFRKETFRTINLKKGVKAIIGVPKMKKNPSEFVDQYRPDFRDNPMPHWAKTIVKQMGGYGRLRAFLGVKQIVYDEKHKAVQFKFPNKKQSKPNVVSIQLLPTDLYRMDFYRVGKKKGLPYKKELASIEGLYWDQLIPLFERETGLYLRFNNPSTEKVTVEWKQWVGDGSSEGDYSIIETAMVPKHIAQQGLIHIFSHLFDEDIERVKEQWKREERMGLENVHFIDDITAIEFLNIDKKSETWMIKPSVRSQENTLDEIDAACVHAGLHCHPYYCGYDKRHYIVIEGNSSVIKKILSPWRHKIEEVEESRSNPEVQEISYGTSHGSGYTTYTATSKMEEWPSMSFEEAKAELISKFDKRLERANRSGFDVEVKYVDTAWGYPLIIWAELRDSELDDKWTHGERIRQKITDAQNPKELSLIQSVWKDPTQYKVTTRKPQGTPWEIGRSNPKTVTLYPTEETIAQNKAEEAFYNLINQRAEEIGVVGMGASSGGQTHLLPDPLPAQFWELWGIVPPNMGSPMGIVRIIHLDYDEDYGGHHWTHWQIDGDKFLHDDWEIYLTPKE